MDSKYNGLNKNEHDLMKRILEDDDLKELKWALQNCKPLKSEWVEHKEWAYDIKK